MDQHENTIYTDNSHPFQSGQFGNRGKTVQKKLKRKPKIVGYKYNQNWKLPTLSKAMLKFCYLLK